MQINVLEYMHSKGYVHADIKGANILLGLGKAGAEQCYLVDFGLANHYSTKEYKPDPKNAHNGTIEYTSRDAHNGVSTMRGDFEVLGLNLVHWSGLDLPWESQKLLANAKKVQESKEQYMKNLDKQLSGAPEAIRSFMKYVERMRHDDQPDYEKCRGYLEKGLKVCGKDNKGPLEFEEKGGATATTSATPKKRARAASKSPQDEVAVVKSPRRKTPVVAAPAKKASRKRIASTSSTEGEEEVVKEPAKRSSPKNKKSSMIKSKDDSSIIILDSPTPTPTTDDVKRRVRERQAGKMIVNNDITPKTTAAKKAKKTYEFNFELDVSIDADVVVNVKRKRGKGAAAAAAVSGEGSAKKSTPLASSSSRGKLMASESPITPVVRKRIARNVKVTPSGTVRVEKG